MGDEDALGMLHVALQIGRQMPDVEEPISAVGGGGSVDLGA